MIQSTINLLRPAEKESAKVATIKEETRRFTFLAFIVFLGVGLLVLAVSIIMELSIQSLKQTNKTLRSQIEQYKQLENMLAVVKTRTSVVENALAYSKPVDTQIAYMHEIARPPTLQTLTYDETDKIAVTYMPISIEETMAMAGALIMHAENNHIRNPRIDSYSIDKEGMRIVFSFSPVWE